MTPEEKFNQEVWWVLQAIKKEQLSTPTGENVKINTIRIANRDANSPPTNDISKCFRKLEEWGAFRVVEKHNADSYDPYECVDTDWDRATEFLLYINQQKFDELYRLYESGFNHQDSGKQPSTTTKNQPVIKSKILKLIAHDIGDLDTGTNLINFLVDCGVDRELIVYPQTKWQMIYDVLLKLATSNKAKDKETLFKIVGDAVHPLTHGGDISSAKNLLNKFNSYLSYDNGHITLDGEENTYKVYFVPTKKEREEIMAEHHADLGKQKKKRFDFLCQPKNKEKISLLRKTYQALMGVVEVFCRNFLRLYHEDIVELNKHYLALDKSVWSIIDELQLGGTFDAYKKYPRPFSNLFSAEKELNGEISWNVIRREMSARFGEIETLYQKVNASDILAESNKQKQLNDVTLYLSELKEKTKETKRDEKIKKPPVTKIEIEGLLDGLKEIAKTKKNDKNKFPYKLPAGTKWENFTIKFEDDENVFIQVKQFKHNVNYEKMGMVGRGKNPNPSEAWTLLRVLAKVNGELTIKDAEARDKYKKQKELLVKSLQNYFSLDYDPFYPYRSSTEKSGDSYKIKITLIPPPADSESTDTEKDKDDLGLKEYLDEQTPQVYEDQ